MYTAEPAGLESIKLVLAGPVGAGKTTAIRSVADGEPVSTEVPLLDGAVGDKTTTTVALDFATVLLEDGQPLFLYGLPGQEHFSFMRTIMLDGALGVIIVLDGSDERIAEQCKHWLESIRSIDPDMPLAIGVTKTETVAQFSLGAIRAAIRSCGAPVPTFTFDARDRQQTTQLLRALILQLS